GLRPRPAAAPHPHRGRRRRGRTRPLPGRPVGGALGVPAHPGRRGGVVPDLHAPDRRRVIPLPGPRRTVPAVPETEAAAGQPSLWWNGRGFGTFRGST